jgi:sec-independent protein translocase protein TatA
MFDPSAPHIIILLIVVLLLFGSRRLPGAAKSLGESMHIFKKSVQGINPDDQDSAANPPPTATAVQYATLTPQQAVSAAPDATAQQLADLQRQLNELQQQQAGSGTAEQANASQPF